MYPASQCCAFYCACYIKLLKTTFTGGVLVKQTHSEQCRGTCMAIGVGQKCVGARRVLGPLCPSIVYFNPLPPTLLLKGYWSFYLHRTSMTTKIQRAPWKSWTQPDWPLVVRVNPMMKHVTTRVVYIKISFPHSLKWYLVVQTHWPIFLISGGYTILFVLVILTLQVLVPLEILLTS